MEKFCEVNPPGPKVIGDNTLNCGPIFKLFIVKKNCCGTAVLDVMCISKPWSFCSSTHQGPNYGLPNKLNTGGSK